MFRSLATRLTTRREQRERVDLAVGDERGIITVYSEDFICHQAKNHMHRSLATDVKVIPVKLRIYETETKDKEVDRLAIIGTSRYPELFLEILFDDFRSNHFATFTGRTIQLWKVGIREEPILRIHVYLPPLSFDLSIPLSPALSWHS